MPVTLDMKWWKKTKPLTLMGETVTDAMKQVDAATEGLFKEATRENMSKLSGALKTLQGSFTQTKAKCNKTLHGDCIKALTEAEAKAQKAYTAVQLMQTNYAAELQVYQTRRTAVTKTLTDLSKSKDLNKVAAAQKEVEDFLAYLNDGIKAGKLSSSEMERGMKYLSAGQVLLRDIEKGKTAPTEAGAKAKWDKQVAAQFTELGATATKIGALGGYNQRPVAAASYKVEM